MRCHSSPSSRWRAAQPHITARSECFQPLQDRGIGAPTRQRFRGWCVSALQDLALQVEVNGGILIRRVDAGMAEPLPDRAQVDPGFQQMYRGAMPPMSFKT